MAKVWIDVLTPKQVQFSFHLSRRLKSAGYDVFLTTRRYREVNELLAQKGLSAMETGVHGGKTLDGKLMASALRIKGLIGLVTKYKPSIAVSFCSPEAARVAFGLNIPHICICDSPHAEAVCRLTIPLSAKILTPKVIPLSAWRRYGATRDAIVRYNAIDPVVWIKPLKPDPTVLNKIGLTSKKPIIVFRVEESFAAYLLGKVREETSTIIPVLEDLMKRLKDSAQFVVLPRYREHFLAFRDLGMNLIVPKVAIDGPSLLSYTSIFIGAGGTMTAEAALLGVPTISCYPGKPTFIEKYLIARGLVVRAVRPEKAVQSALSIFSHLKDAKQLQEEKAKRIISGMEDPVEVIIKTIEAHIS